MKRPVGLKPAVSRSDFLTGLAEAAASLAQWIELSVTAFPADPAARKARLAAIEDPVTGFETFLTTYLPHYVRGPASLFHRRVFDRAAHILGNPGAHELFIAPRGSSKSTHLSLGFVIYLIVTDRIRYAIEVCDVYGQAALLIEAIKAELTNNPRLAYDFPKAVGAGRVWREGEIVTRNQVRVEGLGAGQKIRGRRHGPHRPDLLIFDDLENDEAVRSPEQRDKLWGWVNRAALKVGASDGSLRVIWVGTVLHYDAVLVRASKSSRWHVTETRAIERWPDRMDLWDEFDRIWQTDGEPAARAWHAERAAEMDAGAVVNWPDVQPLVSLMLERASSPSAFASEYQNQPLADGNPFEVLPYWSQLPPGLVVFAAIDPSLGRAGKGRDPSAILVGGLDRLTGRLYLIEASIRRRLPDVIIADAIAMHRQHRPLLWFVEAIQFQEFLRTSLMVEAAKQGVGIAAVPVVPHTDKALRIERLQPPLAAGLIRLSPDHTTLIQQLQQWPHGDHDDGPDCLEMLWTHALHYGGGAGSPGGVDTTPGSAGAGLADYRL